MTYEEWWDTTDKDGTPFVDFTFGEEVWNAAREELLKQQRAAEDV